MRTNSTGQVVWKIEGMMVARATAAVKCEGLLIAYGRAPGRTVVGTGSPVYIGLGPRYVTIFGNFPREVAPGMPGATYPGVATGMVAVVNATCSAVVTKSAVVPASAGGVTPGESFANFADQSVSSTSVISTEVSPVVGTPGTTRGPM